MWSGLYLLGGFGMNPPHSSFPFNNFLAEMKPRYKEYIDSLEDHKGWIPFTKYVELFLLWGNHSQ